MKLPDDMPLEWRMRNEISAARCETQARAAGSNGCLLAVVSCILLDRNALWWGALAGVGSLVFLGLEIAFERSQREFLALNGVEPTPGVFARLWSWLARTTRASGPGGTP